MDGHNVENLVDVLKDLRGRKGPQLLHVITKRQWLNSPKTTLSIPRCRQAAERSACPEVKPAAAKPTYTQVFGQWLCDQAAADERLVAITPAMREGSGLDLSLNSNSPTAISTSASPSNTPLPLPAVWRTRGIKPVVAIYSTFLQRAYDQLVP